MNTDEAWFDELLRPADETAPETLRAQVMELAAGAASTGDPRRIRLTLVVSAAAVAALIIGLVIFNTSEPTLVDITPAGDPVDEDLVPPPESSTLMTDAAVGDGTTAPTVTYREDVTWWIPTWLPDDLSFQHAVQESDSHRRIEYGASDCSPACERQLYVSITRTSAGAPIRSGIDTVTDVDGNIWQLDSTSDGSASAFSQSGGEHIEIYGAGIGIDELTQIAQSVQLLPETELPRPPLVCCSYVRSGRAEPGLVVTRLEIPSDAGTPTWELRAHTDGSTISLSGFEQAEDTFGPGYRVSSGDPLAFGGRPGFYTEPRPPVGTAIVYGVAHPDVAAIEVELAEGDAITVTPEDVSGHFAESFFFLSFPYPDDGQSADVFAAITAILAKDTDGNTLAVYQYPDWTSP